MRIGDLGLRMVLRHGQASRGWCGCPRARRRDHSAIRNPQSFREPPVHHEDAAEVVEHDVIGLEVAVDDALAVREGERVADFLEDGQERRVRILLRRRLGAAGEEVEHLLQGDAAHQLHGVVGQAVFIYAEFADGRDVRGARATR